MNTILSTEDNETLIAFAKEQKLNLSEISGLVKRLTERLEQFHKELKIMGCSGFIKFYQIQSVLSDIMDTCNLYGVKNL